MLEQIIKASGYNKSSFALFVGVNRKTVYNWMQKKSRFDITECADLEKKLQLENGELYSLLTGNTKNLPQVLEKLSKLNPEKTNKSDVIAPSQVASSTPIRQEVPKSIWDDNASLFVREGTLRTPAIEFDMEKGILKISGRSTPDSAADFYKPLEDALERFMQGVPKKELTIDVLFEYINTATTKKLLDIFKRAEEYYKQGNKVIILWNYEMDDEDGLEMGEDYQVIINIPFKFNEFQNKFDGA